jgi:serine/threonine protein kinase
MLPTPPTTPVMEKPRVLEHTLPYILADRYQLVGVLGRGAYGVVYSAIDMLTNTRYAIKALPKHGLDSRQAKFQQRELELHYAASRHPNVVSMYAVFDTSDCTYVVLEYCSEGDLFTNITERGHYIFNDVMAQSIFLQLLDAVEHCHLQGIYHRDLKPENVLVTRQGREVKLADFGLATREEITSDFGCGSTFYMSPECQQTSPKPFSAYHAAPNDIWSLGVILVNLTCGRNPWKKASSEDSTFRAYYNDPAFLKSILPITDEFYYILRRIFDLNPATRAEIPELRALIQTCPQFTKASVATLPPQPVYEYMRPQPVYQEEMPLTPEEEAVQYYYSSSPATLSASSTASFEYQQAPTHVRPVAPQQQQQQPQQQYSTTTKASYPQQQNCGSWYSAVSAVGSQLMPAFDHLQKYMSVQPITGFPGVRML